MGYEVDFLPVEAGGAAICVRWGTPGNYKVLVYDGGTVDSGEHLVRHVESHYMTSRVDYVVSSHPACDHSAGLAVVLRKLRVGELWMRRARCNNLRIQRGSLFANPSLAPASAPSPCCRLGETGIWTPCCPPSASRPSRRAGAFSSFSPRRTTGSIAGWVRACGSTRRPPPRTNRAWCCTPSSTAAGWC